MNVLYGQVSRYLPKFPKPSFGNTTLNCKNLHLTKTNLDKIGSELETTPVKAVQEEEPDKLYKLLELEMRANQAAVLKSYATFTDLAAKELGIEVGKSWAPKKPDHDRYTVLRSAFVHKHHRVQYEFRTYYRFMQLHRLTGSTADTYLEYIERNLPEGVALKVTKIAVEKVPEHLVPPKKSASSHVEAS